MSCSSRSPHSLLPPTPSKRYQMGSEVSCLFTLHLDRLYPTPQKLLQRWYKATVYNVDMSGSFLRTTAIQHSHTLRKKMRKGNQILPQEKWEVTGDATCFLLLVSLTVFSAQVALGSMVEGASSGRRRNCISHSWIIMSLSWASWIHSASSPGPSSAASEV